MHYRFANIEDIVILEQNEKHIGKAEIFDKIRRNEVLIAEEEGEFAGWLRYNLFWDHIPFINMLFIMEKFRGHDFGTELVNMWENRMKLLGFDQVMTSTLSNESSQNFYRKLGYRDVGSLLLSGEATEIIMLKQI